MAGFFSLLALVLCWGGEPGSSPTAGEIAAAVQRLGADRFQQRQDASEFLWRAGDAAIPALREAVQNGEPEVRLRAAAILENLKYGLRPDTPPEVAALVRRFRLGDREAQREALHALLRQERLEHVLLLLQASNDAALTSEFLKEVQAVIPRLLAEAREDDAETILALAADPDRFHEQGQRDYAAFLLLRGRLDEKIAELEAAGPPDDRQARLLARLLQTRGDYAAALPLARQAEDESLTSELLFRLGRWKELSEEQRIPGDPGVEQFGFAAAFHRLAGNDAAYEAALDSLEKLAETDPDELWMCGEALMIAGAWDRAERVFVRHAPRRAFDLLAVQLRAGDAFQRVGIAEPRTGAAAWYSQRAPALVKGFKESETHFFVGLEAASLLYRLGERDEPAKLFEETARSARTDSSLSMHAVVQVE
jgi:tetratricopeptide (TPR) repeat protein